MGESSSSSSTTTTPFTGQAASYVYGPLQNKILEKLNGTEGYTGQLNVGQTADQTNAYNTLKNAANNNDYIFKTASGSYVDPSTNPYYQKTLDMNSKAVSEAMNKGFDSINSSFGRQGFLNSSMRKGALENQVKTAGDTLADMATQLGSSYYNTGTQNAQNAYNAQNSAYGNVLNAATGLQSQAQSDLERQRQEYWQRVGQTDKNVGLGIDYANTIKNPTQTTEQTSSSPLRSSFGLSNTDKGLSQAFSLGK